VTQAPPWLDVIDNVIGACGTHRRPDLAHRLRQKRARLIDPMLRVLVMGEPNQGKSQLVNALVNAPVCPVDDDVSAAVKTIVQHAETASAVLVDGSGRLPVPIERVGEELGRRADVVTAEIGIPRTLLARGLVLVDSPPATHPGCADDADDADVVVLASDATSELSPTELELLQRVRARCPEVVVALTKIDLAPHWRQVAERNRGALANAGVPATQIPVSAALRLHAARTDDPAINAESGFAVLVERLQALVAAKPNALAPPAAALAVRAVVEQLIGSLHAELSDDGAPAGPGLSPAAAPGLSPAAPPHDAQRAVEELRRGAAKAQTILADEMADLSADLDYDLRDRARSILREVDRVFDDADPLPQWEEFEKWLHANLADAADANFSWLIERCRWIADKVVHHFPHPCEAPPQPIGAGYHDVDQIEKPRLERFTIGQQAFTGLRGSYGGVLMFGLVTSLTVGMPLINPISVGAGVLFGGRSIKEESEARLRRRQAIAKAAVQRHVDDFFLRYGKDCRDVARQVQRGLRDHFAALADELQDGIAQAVLASRQASAARDHRHRELRRELEQLIALDGKVTRPALEITA